MAILVVGLVLVFALLSLVELRLYRLHIRQLADNYAAKVYQPEYYNLVDLFELDAWQAGKDIPVTVYDL